MRVDNPLHNSNNHYTIPPYNSILMSIDRRLWSPEEDQQIIRLVHKYGTKKWPLISEKLCAETDYERTGKQCRQRWYNHLNPEINNSFWSQQDERKLFEAHKIHGNKWKVISKEFIGRTDNSIKNHFYSTIRRCLRRINKFQGEKNSTLKMRNIKPYVLSKILADRNLTQSILEMGKTKPNKNRRDINSQYFRQFNQMIQKLYAINQQYETLKLAKRHNSNPNPTPPNPTHPSIPTLQPQLQPQGSNIDEQMQEQERNISASVKHSIEKIESEVEVKVSEQRESMSPTKMNRKGLKKTKKRVTIAAPSTPQQILFKETLTLRTPQSSSRRHRRPINYMKLNQGILCESQRPQPQETNNESEVIKKKRDNYDPFEDGQSEHLEEIIEEEEKSNEKDNLNAMLGSDLLQLKPLSNFNICNPSPSFRQANSFQELVVIGTHLKLNVPSSQACGLLESQRKRSEQEFIEQILQINFDPNLAEEQEEDDS